MKISLIANRRWSNLNCAMQGKKAKRGEAMTKSRWDRSEERGKDGDTQKKEVGDIAHPASLSFSAYFSLEYNSVNHQISIREEDDILLSILLDCRLYFCVLCLIRQHFSSISTFLINLTDWLRCHGVGLLLKPFITVWEHQASCARQLKLQINTPWKISISAQRCVSSVYDLIVG